MSRKRSAMPSLLNAQPAVKKQHDEATQDRVASRHLREQACRDKITEANATNSPLLRLPAELRNMIYAYVFGDNKWTFTGWNARKNSAKESDLALLLTSRQLHKKTALLSYMLGRFYFRMMFMGIEAGEV
ncbi:hypothetical protein J4E91_006860 [Alternaria rosae]|nr:hypothetical protein J4E91_006860 [Alternaria rosae]